MLIAVWHQDGGQEDPSLGSRANPTSWASQHTLGAQKLDFAPLLPLSIDVSSTWPIFSPASSQEPSPPPRLPAAFLRKVCGARGEIVCGSVQLHGLKTPSPTSSEVQPKMRLTTHATPSNRQPHPSPRNPSQEEGWLYS